MTTQIFHIRLDPEPENASQTIALVEAILAHLGDGSLITHDCLEVATDRPDIAGVLEALFPGRQLVPPAAAPADAAPQPKTTRKKRAKGVALLPEATAVQTNDQPAETVDQFMLWRLPDGREVNSISLLLARHKLQVGQHVRNRDTGVFEVVEPEPGKLRVRRLNGRQPVDEQPAATEEQP